MRENNKLFFTDSQREIEFNLLNVAAFFIVRSTGDPNIAMHKLKCKYVLGRQNM